METLNDENYMKLKNINTNGKNVEASNLNHIHYLF